MFIGNSRKISEAKYHSSNNINTTLVWTINTEVELIQKSLKFLNVLKLSKYLINEETSIINRFFAGFVCEGINEKSPELNALQ